MSAPDVPWMFEAGPESVSPDELDLRLAEAFREMTYVSVESLAYHAEVTVDRCLRALRRHGIDVDPDAMRRSLPKSFRPQQRSLRLIRGDQEECATPRASET